MFSSDEMNWTGGRGMVEGGWREGLTLQLEMDAVEDKMDVSVAWKREMEVEDSVCG